MAEECGCIKITIIITSIYLILILVACIEDIALPHIAFELSPNYDIISNINNFYKSNTPNDTYIDEYNINIGRCINEFKYTCLLRSVNNSFDIKLMNSSSTKTILTYYCHNILLTDQQINDNAIKNQIFVGWLNIAYGIYFSVFVFIAFPFIIGGIIFVIRMLYFNIIIMILGYSHDKYYTKYYDNVCRYPIEKQRYSVIELFKLICAYIFTLCYFLIEAYLFNYRTKNLLVEKVEKVEKYDIGNNLTGVILPVLLLLIIEFIWIFVAFLIRMEHHEKLNDLITKFEQKDRDLNLKYSNKHRELYATMEYYNHKIEDLDNKIDEYDTKVKQQKTIVQQCQATKNKLDEKMKQYNINYTNKLLDF